MGKSKAPKQVQPAEKNGRDKTLTSVKDAAVTKPSQTPKAKSKDVAKDVAMKVGKDKKSKKVKEPTPESSESESESESEAEASDEDTDMDSASSASSGEEAAAPKKNGVTESSESEDSDSESEAPAKAKPTEKAAPKANGVNKKAAEEESASSDSSESSADSSDDEAKPATTAGKQVADVEKDSDESDGSESDESDNDAKPKGAVDAKALNGKLKKASAEASSESEGSDSESESEGSDSGSDESEDESEEEAPPKKRKAEEVSTPAAKKTKTSGGDDETKKNLFVGQLSWNVNTEWLQRHFEQYGEIESATVIEDKQSGRSKGFGYVKFVDASSAIKAQAELHRSDLDGRTINVDFSAPRDSNTPRQERADRYGDRQTSAPSATLFVANLNFEVTYDTLRDAFAEHAAVIGTRLPTDRDSGAPKGFGYVEFSSIDEAKKAFDAMSGASILGRPIRLDYSTPRDNNSSPNNFRGGRGGGRGGFDRGGRGGGRGRGGDRGGRGGGRGGSTNRGGFGDFQGKKMSFD